MDQPEPIETWLSFADLKRANVVSNWQTLKNWQESYGFPRGVLFGALRRWRKSEIDQWTRSRPIEREVAACGPGGAYPG